MGTLRSSYIIRWKLLLGTGTWKRHCQDQFEYFFLVSFCQFSNILLDFRMELNICIHDNEEKNIKETLPKLLILLWKLFNVDFFYLQTIETCYPSNLYWHFIFGKSTDNFSVCIFSPQYKIWMTVLTWV